MQIPIDQDGAAEIALRSRGTPRIANRLLRRVRDYAQVRGTGVIDRPTANAALTMLEVDAHGFDEIDRRLLLTIIQKYDGGPVGLGTLAATLAEEEDALEEVYEPFLIQIGFLDRTPRGRVATRLAYEHFGLDHAGQADAAVLASYVQILNQQTISRRDSMALTESTMLELGTMAPDFALTDVVTGKTVRRDDFRGQEGAAGHVHLRPLPLCEAHRERSGRSRQGLRRKADRHCRHQQQRCQSRIPPTAPPDSKRQAETCGFHLSLPL